MQQQVAEPELWTVWLSGTHQALTTTMCCPTQCFCRIDPQITFRVLCSLGLRLNGFGALGRTTDKHAYSVFCFVFKYS